MTQTGGFQGFIQLVIAEVGTIPRRGLIYLGIAGVVSAAIDLLLWSHRPNFLPLDWTLTSLFVVVWVGLAYVVSMLMVGTRGSLSGLLKFVTTTLALAAPMIVAAALLLASLKFKNAAGISAGFVLLIAGFVFLTLLPGWPVLQATSERFIGPLSALRSTKGFRWALFAAASLGSSLNKLVLGASTTDDFATACALVAVSTLVGLLSGMIGLSVAVAAFRLMKSALDERPAS